MTGDRIMSDRLARASAIVADLAAMALARQGNPATLETTTKAPFDFVSEADTAVETRARTALAEAFPGESVLGEEFGGGLGPAAWVIDPIDGTRGFLRGSPFWAVSLGFLRDGQPSAGIIALPALGRIVAAEIGGGVFVDGVPFTRVVPFEAVSIASLGDDVDEMGAIVARMRESGRIATAYRSTALCMAHVALGHLDGHLQKKVALWDMAAGLAICREAGLTVRYGGADPKAMWVAAGTDALLDEVGALWPEAGGVEPALTRSEPSSPG